MADTALVVVDMQEYYLNPASDFYRFAEFRQPGSMSYISERCSKTVIPNIQRLLQFFRDKKKPVIFFKLCGKNRDRSDLHRFFKKEYDRGCSSGFPSVYPLIEEPMSGVLKSIEPLKNEMVYHKTTFSAFHSTPIQKDLKAKKIKNLVFTGLATSQCVETTARDASDCGFRILHVEDAQADYSETFHRVSLYASAAVCGGWLYETDFLIQQMDEVLKQLRVEE